MKNTLGAWATITFLASGAAFAEEPPGPPPVWSGKAEASFVSTTGNTDVQTIGAGFEVDYKKDVWDGLAKGAFVQGKTDGEGLLHRLYDHVLDEPVPERLTALLRR